MTPEELAQVLAFIVKATGRSVDDADDAEVWHRALRGLTYSDVTQAVEDHVAESTEYLTPARIRQRVRAIRQRRLQAAGAAPLPNADPANVAQYQAWLSAWRDAVASGTPPCEAVERADTATGAVCRPRPTRQIAPDVYVPQALTDTR